MSRMKKRQMTAHKVIQMPMGTVSFEYGCFKFWSSQKKPLFRVKFNGNLGTMIWGVRYLLQIGMSVRLSVSQKVRMF